MHSHWLRPHHHLLFCILLYCHFLKATFARDKRYYSLKISSRSTHQCTEVGDLNQLFYYQCYLSFSSHRVWIEPWLTCLKDYTCSLAREKKINYSNLKFQFKLGRSALDQVFKIRFSYRVGILTETTNTYARRITLPPSHECKDQFYSLNCQPVQFSTSCINSRNLLNQTSGHQLQLARTVSKNPNNSFLSVYVARSWLPDCVWLIQSIS